MARALKKAKRSRSKSGARQKRASVVSRVKKTATRGVKHVRTTSKRRVVGYKSTTARNRAGSKSRKRAAGSRKVSRQVPRAVSRSPKTRKRVAPSKRNGVGRAAKGVSRHRETTQLKRELANARDALRQRDRLIADITRSPSTAAGLRKDAAGVRDAGASFEAGDSLPPGAVALGPSYPGAYTMSDYVEGSAWGDIDWDEVDWDDYYEDVGPEEEEVDYGEH